MLLTASTLGPTARWLAAALVSVGGGADAEDGGTGCGQEPCALRAPAAARRDAGDKDGGSAGCGQEPCALREPAAARRDDGEKKIDDIFLKKEWYDTLDLFDKFRAELLKDLCKTDFDSAARLAFQGGFQVMTILFVAGEIHIFTLDTDNYNIITLPLLKDKLFKNGRWAAQAGLATRPGRRAGLQGLAGDKRPARLREPIKVPKGPAGAGRPGAEAPMLPWRAALKRVAPASP
jgi:hypothetical protein